MEIQMQMLAEESVLDSNIKYGALYNWFAVETGKLAPQGWAIPTDTEWTTFTTYINDNYNVAPNNFGVGNHLKHRRKNGAPVEAGFDTSVEPRWDAHVTQYGRDTLNWGGIPGGIRNTSGVYSSVGVLIYLWSITEFSLNNAWCNYLSFSNNGFVRENNAKKFGFSVRCFRAATTTEQSLPDGRLCVNARDVDGNVYNTVKIGSGVDAKVWMIQNLATTKYNDGSAIPNVTGNAAWAALTTAAYCWYNNDRNNGIYTAIKDTIFTRTLYRQI